MSRYASESSAADSLVFAFIPNAVKKRKKPVPLSGHAPSATISVGAQVTSEECT